MLKKVLALAALALLVTACASGDEGPPEMSEAVQADLSARALAIACEQYCVGNEVPIRDLVYETPTTPLEGPPLSDVQRRAMTQQFLAVRFVNDEDVSALLSEGEVALVVGPVSANDEGRAEVEVAAERPEGLEVIVQVFRWDGDVWVPTSA